MDSETITLSSTIGGKIMYAKYVIHKSQEGSHEEYTKKNKDLGTGSVYEERGYTFDASDWDVLFFLDGVKWRKFITYKTVDLNYIFQDFDITKKFQQTSKIKNFAVKKSLIRIK